MRISIETTLLATDSLLAPHSGITLNGQQVVDDAHFFRAAAARVFARGNFGTTLQFTVHRVFSSPRAAEVFYLTHCASVPKSGLVTAVCGTAGDQQSCYLEDAVLEAVAMPPFRGVSVDVQYTIRGGVWTTDVPPDIPGEPEPGEEFVVLRRGKVAIAAGATHVDVVFSSPLSAVPVVSPTISRPTGGDNIRPILREDTVTINGFTVDLSAPTPNADFKLHYIAVE